MTFDVDVLLRHWAEVQPGSLAFADENIEVTFADINLDARKIAYVLTQKGIKRGDIVVIALPPYLAWTFSFSLQLLGATILPKSVEVKFQENIEIDWFIGLDLDRQIPPERSIIFNVALLDQVKSAPAIESAPGYESSNIPRFIFSTSGTTGLKKYVSVTISELEHSLAQVWPIDQHGVDEVMIGQHFGGAISTVYAYKLFSRGKLLVNPNFYNSSLLALIEKYRVRSIYASPVQISEILDIADRAQIQIKDFAVVNIAGSHPPEMLLERIRKNLGSRIFNGYGSSEAGLIALNELTEDSRSGGSICQGVTLQIVDDEDRFLANEVSGRIRYTRAGMPTSYFKNPEATEEFFKDAFFYPGDLGFINDIGELVLTGRSAEVINLGGVKINPETLDVIAINQLGVHDCAAFGVTGISGMEELAIALVTDGDFDLEFFKKAMASKSPATLTHIVMVDEIPRNPNGKILRQELSEGFHA